MRLQDVDTVSAWTQAMVSQALRVSWLFMTTLAVKAARMRQISVPLSALPDQCERVSIHIRKANAPLEMLKRWTVLRQIISLAKGTDFGSALSRAPITDPGASDLTKISPSRLGKAFGFEAYVMVADAVYLLAFSSFTTAAVPAQGNTILRQQLTSRVGREMTKKTSCSCHDQHASRQHYRI